MSSRSTVCSHVKRVAALLNTTTFGTFQRASTRHSGVASVINPVQKSSRSVDYLQATVKDSNFSKALLIHDFRNRIARVVTKSVVYGDGGIWVFWQRFRFRSLGKPVGLAFVLASGNSVALRYLKFEEARVSLTLFEIVSLIYPCRLLGKILHRGTKATLNEGVATGSSPCHQFCVSEIEPRSAG